MPNAKSPTVLITPLKLALIAGAAQKLPVLVRIQAPDPDPAMQSARGPYHLALVIDRSGSMSGAPLAEAVRCAWDIVTRLQPTDRAALVVFDDGVDLLVPAQPVGDRGALYAHWRRCMPAARPTCTAAGRRAPTRCYPPRPKRHWRG